ncbi:MAG: hypothetical protein EAZ53_05425 [Bacteroidetes bacterium]|nr:MAG: hypothetical protein EAZ53_05425 [Bacteroidota bacterium]
MKYNIKTFAILTDLLGDSFEISAENNSIESLKKSLIERNPTAEKILASSRFVVENRFVENDYVFKNEQLILIMPPSSGG